MAGIRGLTPGDARAMLRLSRALSVSDDAVSRKKRFLAGLCTLLEAGSALNVVANVETSPRRQTIISVTRHGTPRAREDQLLGRCLPALENTPLALDHLGPPQWQHVLWPVRASPSARICHCVQCTALTQDARVVACLLLSRAPGDQRPFAAHQRMLLHLSHIEMSWVYETDLLLATHGALSLSPRQRQTLEYLLSGYSEKQIASKMRLSPNTVHHHVKALHRHFGVSSRSELLARWVR